MKKPLIVWFILFLMASCSHMKSDEFSIVGNWASLSKVVECKYCIPSSIQFSFYEGGLYHESSQQDDVGHDSKGKYFIFNNKARNAKTITLIPDSTIMSHRGGTQDTLYLPCENWDIIKLTKDTLLIRLPTQIISRDSSYIMKNETVKFIRSK